MASPSQPTDPSVAKTAGDVTYPCKKCSCKNFTSSGFPTTTCTCLHDSSDHDGLDSSTSTSA